MVLAAIYSLIASHNQTWHTKEDVKQGTRPKKEMFSYVRRKGQAEFS